MAPKQLSLLCLLAAKLEDINPIDFFLWSVIERQTNRIPYNINDKLIIWIEKEF
uniref:Uncharacterized protein n=1 Tax=Lepeophtheirus salmonis TaxID=72036 RepID=A0A0K2UCN7_LEPSM